MTTAHADTHGHDTGTADHGHDAAHGAADHGHEAHHAAPNSVAIKNVEDLRWGTTNRLRNVVHTAHQKTRHMELEPLPPLPSKMDALKTAGLVGALAVPHLAATAYVGYKAYDMAARYTPVKYVDQAAKAGANVLLNESKKILNLATAPVRLAKPLVTIPATAVMNTLRLGAKGIMNFVVTPAVDMITDFETAINHSYDLPEGTNIPAQILIAGKNLVKNVVYDIPKGMLKFAYDHPKTAIIGGFLTTGILANAGWDIGVATTNVLHASGELIKWIVARFPSA